MTTLRNSPKKTPAAINLALVAIAGLLMASSNWAVKLVGFCLSIGSVGVHRRHELLDSDYLDGAAGIWRELHQGGRFLVQEVAPTRKEIHRVYVKLKQPQPTLKARLEVAAERLLQDKEWFAQFNRRSHLAVGNTGDGKTQWMLNQVATFLQEHPEGHLIIIDLDYGSSHEGTKPNTWFDLPKQRYICTSEQAALDAILDEYDELKKRVQLSEEGKRDFQWRFLCIDEAIAVIRYAKRQGKEVLEQLLEAIGELLYRGLKQRIKIAFGLQVLAVSETNLNLALQKQNNVILLGSAAVDPENLSRIGCRNANEIIEQVKSMRSLPGCKYAAVVRAKGEISVQVVPPLDFSNIKIEVPDPERDELEQWWAEVFDTKTQMWLRMLAEQHLSGEIKSPLKPQILPRFGIQKALRSDPKYCKVADAWEEAKQYAQAISPEVAEATESTETGEDQNG